MPKPMYFLILRLKNRTVGSTWEFRLWIEVCMVCQRQCVRICAWVTAQAFPEACLPGNCGFSKLTINTDHHKVKDSLSSKTVIKSAMAQRQRSCHAPCRRNFKEEMRGEGDRKSPLRQGLHLSQALSQDRSIFSWIINLSSQLPWRSSTSSHPLSFTDGRTEARSQTASSGPHGRSRDHGRFKRLKQELTYTSGGLSHVLHQMQFSYFFLYI